MITVFKFGIGRLAGATREALEQIYKRRQLRNKLVEIELGIQGEFDALTAHVDQTALDASEKELLALVEQEKQAKIDTKSRKTSVDLKEARAKVKALRDTWRVDKKTARELVKPALDELEKRRREAIKVASTSFGLWWCNYDAVLTDHETSRQRLLSDRKNGRPAEFRFHRFDGQGSLSVRYQTGLPLAEVVKDTRFQIALPEPAIYGMARHQRRVAMRTTARIRVGSQGRSPIWLELQDVHVHRPLPPGAVIRQVEVHLQKVAGCHRGVLCLVVQVPDPIIAAHRTETVAVDIGWRRLANGEARVGMIGLDWGRVTGTVPVYADAQALRDLDQCDRLQSILDKHLNTWKAATGNPLIRSIHRAGLMARDGRHGKGAIPDAHDVYYERYMHLETWRANLRDQALIRRTESYRVVVSRLLCNAKLVLLEDFDIRGVIQGADTNKFRSRCAPSDFRLAIVNYCRREGVEVKFVQAAMSTRKCYYCQREYKWDQARELIHTCLCGKTWDQDENAVRNLLADSQATFTKSEPVEVVA